MERTWHWGLLVALALGARTLLIGGVVWTRGDEGIAQLSSDSPTYIGPALALFRYGELRETPHDTALPMHSRTPAYPLFLAAHYATFGLRHVPVLVTQGLLGAATALAVYALARRWLRCPDGVPGARPMALLAGLAACVSLASLAASACVLSDVLAYALFVAGLCCFTEGVWRRRLAGGAGARAWALWAGAGALWAASCLTHPRLALFPPVIVALGILLAWHFGRRVPWAGIAVTLAVFCVPPVAWAARNKQRLDLFTLSTTASYNLKYHLAVDMAAGSDWRRAKKLRRQWLNAEIRWGFAGHSLPEKVRARYQDAWAAIRQRPAQAARAYLTSFLQYLTCPGTDVYWLPGLSPHLGLRWEVRKAVKWVARVEALIGVLGLVVLWRRARWLALALGLLVLYFAAVAAVGSRQGGRMVLPAEPAYLVLFAAGLHGLACAWRRVFRGAPQEGGHGA